MSIITKNGSIVTEDQLDKLADLFEKGIWPEGSTKILRGRPQLFNEELKPVTFKEPVKKIEAIDARAKELGLSRSNYLRYLVDKDLAVA